MSFPQLNAGTRPVSPITPATVTDIPALVELVNSAYRGEDGRHGWTNEAHLLSGPRTTAAGINELLGKPGSTLFKYTAPDNTVLGCVYLDVQGERLYLGLLSVLPARQDSGIGKQFLAFAEKYAGHHRCTHIHITVISARAELLAWYERHGYRRTGEIQPFHAGTAFGFQKQKIELAVLEKPVPPAA
jgi:ribosomal protein S18 acetylase RimI-like enzyme